MLNEHIDEAVGDLVDDNLGLFHNVGGDRLEVAFIGKVLEKQDEPTRLNNAQGYDFETHFFDTFGHDGLQILAFVDLVGHRTDRQQTALDHLLGWEVAVRVAEQVVDIELPVLVHADGESGGQESIVRVEFRVDQLEGHLDQAGQDSVDVQAQAAQQAGGSGFGDLHVLLLAEVGAHVHESYRVGVDQLQLALVGDTVPQDANNQVYLVLDEFLIEAFLEGVPLDHDQHLRQYSLHKAVLRQIPILPQGLNWYLE